MFLEDNHPEKSPTQVSESAKVTTKYSDDVIPLRNLHLQPEVLVCRTLSSLDPFFGTLIMSLLIKST